MKPLRSLPVVLFVLAAAGVFALGHRLVGAERDGALRSARERLRATAAEASRKLSDFVARLERTAREQTAGSALFRDGRFVHPPEPVATIDLATVPGRDPEGEFLLREADRLEAAGDAARAVAALSAAAGAGRDDAVRSIALARRSALRRRAGDDAAATTDASASLALMDVATRATSRDALMLRLLRMQSGSGDPPLMANGSAGETLLHDLVALLGSADEAVGLGMLSQLGEAAEPVIESRRMELLRMERMRDHAITASSLPPGRSRAAIVGGHVVVAIAADVSEGGTTTTLADAALEDWRPANGVTVVALADPITAGAVVERVPVGAALPDALVEAAIDEAVVAEDARRRALAVALLLALVVLAGAAALAIVLRAVRRESEAARSKTEFVAKVGHDLRTPLALIRMYGETIASGRVDDAAQAREFASIVARESERLTRLVSNVLDFSRLQDDRRATTRIDLGRLAAEVADAHRPLLARDGLTIQLEVPAGPLLVLGQEDALRGALGNLLENALHHASAGKEVLVRVERDGEQAAVEVHDRGPGLPDDALERVFERFVRGPGVNGKGSGLGLALVREVAHGHGGSARARNREGGGLSLTLTLPIAPGSDPRPENGAAR